MQKNYKKEIHRVHIGRVVFCERRTGSGIRTWKIWRPPNFGNNHRRQTIWNSPALQRCLDRFYDEIDYRLLMSERREHERNKRLHEEFIRNQQERKARRNLLALQRGRAN